MGIVQRTSLSGIEFDFLRNRLELRINGCEISVARGITVAAALAIANDGACRKSVSGEPRAPLCGMGICFECRVTINGRPHCRACQTEVAHGMVIDTA